MGIHVTVKVERVRGLPVNLFDLLYLGFGSQRLRVPVRSSGEQDRCPYDRDWGSKRDLKFEQSSVGEGLYIDRWSGW